MTHPFEQRVEVAEDLPEIAEHPKHCLCSGCALQNLLERAHQHMQRLNATRDSQAIRSSAANTRLLISEITAAQGKK